MNNAICRVMRPFVLLATSACVNLHSQPSNAPEAVLQFEPPTINQDGRVITLWTEQGFRVSAPTNQMVHQDSGPLSYPDNGGAYLITFPIQNNNNITISNAAGGLFDVRSVDLAEFSPDIGTNLSTVTFRGISANGMVSAFQTFTLDRIYDGAGPTADFQTFTFMPSFAQLRELWVSTSTRFALDNLRLASATFTNALPEITVLTPTNGQIFAEGHDVVVSAAVSDADGEIARVTFLINGAVHTLTNAPYSIVLSNVLRGTHNLRVTATDDRGAQNSSRTIFFNVVPADAPPMVSFTSPFHGTSVALSEPVVLEVAAFQPAGSIASVAFYEGSILLGIDDSEPWSLVWSNATAGSYFVSAVATDNRATTASASSFSSARKARC